METLNRTWAIRKLKYRARYIKTFYVMVCISTLLTAVLYWSIGVALQKQSVEPTATSEIFVM
jgi:hypothetical protein